MSYGAGEDYELAGKKLLDSIISRGNKPQQFDHNYRHTYNDLDVIHENTQTGGKVCIGNITSAQNLNILGDNGITCVVNCQDISSENFHEKNPNFRYFRFPVSTWWNEPGMDTDQGVLKYFDGLFKWIDSQTAEGRSVLIHCLAGAHRAGTTGVAYTMYAKKLPLSSALHHCKTVRPIVDPFGALVDLLKKLDVALKQ